MVTLKEFSPPPQNAKEIIRYAGAGSEGDLPAGLLESALAEAADKLTFRVCFSVFDLDIKGNTCDFGAFNACSADLCRALRGCRQAVIFAATVGVGIDRLISRYSEISPARALILGAIGAERIEALCDTFCKDFKESFGTNLTPRFSPGYGDFNISAQRDIFAVLDCRKYIGLTLSGSMLMTPSKSVTAVAGLCDKCDGAFNKCGACNKSDCAFRGVK